MMKKDNVLTNFNRSNYNCVNAWCEPNPTSLPYFCISVWFLSVLQYPLFLSVSLIMVRLHFLFRFVPTAFDRLEFRILFPAPVFQSTLLRCLLLSDADFDHSLSAIGLEVERAWIFRAQAKPMLYKSSPGQAWACTKLPSSLFRAYF